MGWGLVITTIINLNIARFLNILTVTSLVNCQRTETKISRKMQFVMWLSGLRGAMAYALALKCATDLPIGPVILIDTLIYSMITILGIGSILNPVLERMGVKQTDEDASRNKAGSSDSSNRPQNWCQRIKARIRYFDNDTFAPLFIKDVKNI